MRNERLVVLVEIALAIALAATLNMPGLRFKLPINIAGGTIALNMLPIFVLAIRRGWGPGIVAGFLYGFVDLLFDPYFVHPAQVVLDYPLAYALVGLGGLLAAPWHRARAKDSPILASVLLTTGLLVGCGSRLFSHWLSGIIFFGEYAPAGQPVWLYSLIYNSSYILPSALMAAAAAAVVLPVLERAVPVRDGRGLAWRPSS
ncbi:MAG: energy-coupled thiamine transporter ThiT [Coriobacteriia bacterium]|nr:energy-coupled thiamine transporter ThiT [Coriobacteriia bacterium]